MPCKYFCASIKQGTTGHLLSRIVHASSTHPGKARENVVDLGMLHASGEAVRLFVGYLVGGPERRPTYHFYQRGQKENKRHGYLYTLQLAYLVRGLGSVHNPTPRMHVRKKTLISGRILFPCGSKSVT